MSKTLKETSAARRQGDLDGMSQDDSGLVSGLRKEGVRSHIPAGF